MTARRYIPLKTKLAAVLCQMLRVDDAGKLVPTIPYDEAKTLTEDQILSRFQWDHWPFRHTDGGPDAHWNLQPMLKADHIEKTAKKDIPEIAETRRITASQEQMRRRLLAKSGQGEATDRPRGKIPSRPFQKRKESRWHTS